MTPKLRTVAHHQGGVFTRAQAIAAGMSASDVAERLLHAEWVVLPTGALACAGTPLSPQARAWAAVLAVGRPVALADEWAAHHLGLERVTPGPDPRLVVPGGRRYAELPGVTVRRVTPASFRAVVVGGLPTVPAAPTVRDLAARLSYADLRDVVHHALRRRQTTLAQLQGTLGRGWSGSAALRRVLTEVAPGYQVVWERRLARALRAAGCPVEPQLEVRLADGRTYVLDLGVRRLRFGIEVDGFLVHMARFAGDRRRDRRLTLGMGWVIAHVAVEEVADDLDAVVHELVGYARDLERAASAARAS